MILKTPILIMQVTRKKGAPLPWLVSHSSTSNQTFGRKVIIGRSSEKMTASHSHSRGKQSVVRTWEFSCGPQSVVEFSRLMRKRRSLVSGSCGTFFDRGWVNLAYFGFCFYERK